MIESNKGKLRSVISHIFVLTPCHEILFSLLCFNLAFLFFFFVFLVFGISHGPSVNYPLLIQRCHVVCNYRAIF